MPDVTCEICSTVFSVKPYRAPTARFCSRACGGVWHAKTRLSGPKPWAVGNKWRAGKRPTNAFPKGHRPWNKGAKGIHLSPDSEFKPGREGNPMPVGSVTVRTDKQGRRRAWVKHPDARWCLRAVVVWELANGPVPAGHVIHHRNRDTLDDRVENLDAMTRAEHLAEHRKEIRNHPTAP